MAIMELISGLFKPASDAYAAKQAAKVQSEQVSAQMEGQKTQATEALAIENLKADEQWEAEAQAQSQWKDELWTLGFFGVFVGSFVPGLQTAVQVGISQLGSYPMWFRVLFCSVVLASFGIRFWRR